MPRKKDDVGTCLQAALNLAGIRGWNNVTLYEIAEEAGLSVATVAEIAGSREGVLRLLAERTDKAMLECVDEDWAEESRKDRLFTLMMARFDQWKDRREGLRSMLASMPGDAGSALRLIAGPGMRSMRLTLEAAGIPTSGVRGAMKVRALGLAHASVLRTFLDDDSDDLSKTMAALDRQLSRLESWSDRLKMKPRKAPGAEPEEASA